MWLREDALLTWVKDFLEDIATVPYRAHTAGLYKSLNLNTLEWSSDSFDISLAELTLGYRRIPML
jgi:hypothetical protein